MGECAKMSRVALITANVFILAASIFGLFFGILALVDKRQFEQLLVQDNYLHSSSYLIVAAGSFGVLTSFFGCVGAWRMNKCMLLVYFVVVLVILILGIAATILSLVFKNSIHMIVNRELGKSIKAYDPYDNTSVLTNAWNDVQGHYNCCGITNGRDWKDRNAYYKPGPDVVPESCCNKNEYCSSNPTGLNSYYYNGCKSVILSNLQMYGLYILIGGSSTGVFMLLVLCCSIVVFRTNKYEVYT